MVVYLRPIFSRPKTKNDPVREVEDENDEDLYSDEQISDEEIERVKKSREKITAEQRKSLLMKIVNNLSEKQETIRWEYLIRKGAEGPVSRFLDNNKLNRLEIYVLFPGESYNHISGVNNAVHVERTAERKLFRLNEQEIEYLAAKLNAEAVAFEKPNKFIFFGRKRKEGESLPDLVDEGYRHFGNWFIRRYWETEDNSSRLEESSSGLEIGPTVEIPPQPCNIYGDHYSIKGIKAKKRDSTTGPVKIPDYLRKSNPRPKDNFARIRDIVESLRTSDNLAGINKPEVKENVRSYATDNIEYLIFGVGGLINPATGMIQYRTSEVEFIREVSIKGKSNFDSEDLISLARKYDAEIVAAHRSSEEERLSRQPNEKFFFYKKK